MRKNKNNRNNTQNKNIQNKETQNPNKLVSALITLEVKVLPRSCSLSQFVEVLHRNDVYLSLAQLVKWLHIEDYINLNDIASEDLYSPITQKSREDGLLFEKVSIRANNDGVPCRHYKLMITCKGQCHFLNQLINRGIGCK